MNTILTTTTPQQPKIVKAATVTTVLEQFGVDTHPKPAVMTYPTKTTSTLNAEAASTPTTISTTYYHKDHSDIYVAVVTGREFEKFASKQLLAKRKKWKKPEYRHAYMVSAVEQGIAWQIKINREKREMSQAKLAAAIGSRQSAVSRAEDPSYGRHSLDTLVKIAHVFDCALQVKFVPYSKLARESVDLSPAAIYAPPYSEEMSE
jgi:ribosome-binding protein aMBF1 (putative translation factor)